MISNINSIYESTLPNSFSYYFYFDSTELYISYPLYDTCEYFLFSLKTPYYDIEAFQCIDENGNYKTVNKKNAKIILEI